MTYERLKNCRTKKIKNQQTEIIHIIIYSILNTSLKYVHQINFIHFVCKIKKEKKLETLLLI